MRTETKMHWNQKLALALLLILANCAANAQVLHKCRDSNGSVLYTDKGATDPRCVVLPSSAPKASTGCPAKGCAVRISKNPDGHFYIKGTINGAQLTFLVDTGANGVMLNPTAASQADVQGSKPILIHTAAGDVQGRLAESVSMSIAGLTPITTAIAINPSLSAPLNLLGQSYLANFRVTAEDTTMVLEPLR